MLTIHGYCLFQWLRLGHPHHIYRGTHSFYSFSYPSLCFYCSKLNEPQTEVSVIIGRLIKLKKVQDWRRDGGYFSKGAALSARLGNISAVEQGEDGEKNAHRQQKARTG